MGGVPSKRGDVDRRSAEHDRPRERLLARGAEALSERELLALLLGKGRRGESALDLAAALLAEHGGLAGVAAARPEELARRPGIGPAKRASRTVVRVFSASRYPVDGPQNQAATSDRNSWSVCRFSNSRSRAARGASSPPSPRVRC